MEVSPSITSSPGAPNVGAAGSTAGAASLQTARRRLSSRVARERHRHYDGRSHGNRAPPGEANCAAERRYFRKSQLPLTRQLWVRGWLR